MLPEDRDTTQIEHEIENIESELQLVETLLRTHRNRELDEIETRAAALSLSTTYTGMEKALQHVLRWKHRVEVRGANWHSALLDEATEHQVISPATGATMRRFLAFRHFVRHAYTFEIDSEMIGAILEKCPELVHRFADEIRCAISADRLLDQSEL